MSSVLDYLTTAEKRKLKAECAIRAAHQETLAGRVRDEGRDGASLLDRAARYWSEFLPAVIDRTIWGGPEDELVLVSVVQALKLGADKAVV